LPFVGSCTGKEDLRSSGSAQGKNVSRLKGTAPDGRIRGGGGSIPTPKSVVRRKGDLGMTEENSIKHRESGARDSFFEGGGLESERERNTFFHKNSGKKDV